MSDIVERMRGYIDVTGDSPRLMDDIREAADEIERLKEILRSVLTASGWDWEDVEACIEGEDEEALGDD